MALDMHNEKGPTCITAGGAFFIPEAWQSGLSHRAYPSADLWASNPLAGSREFESHRFHQRLISGAAAVAASATPINHPGDEPEAKDHLSNIRLAGRTRQSRFGSPLQTVKDELHERTPPR